MLTPMDDFQVHQVVDTIDHVGTSDPAFYERYWFVFGDDSGEHLFVAGLAGYPNRQIVDGMAMVTVDTRRQHNIRFSRDASGDRDRHQPWVGPLKIEVIEGLQRLRVVLEPSSHDFSFDITFDALQQPFERPMDHVRHRGRLITHTCHLNQMGRASGFAVVEGRRLEIDPSRWYGVRDRSWGLRGGDPSLVPEPRPGSRYLSGNGAFWQWVAIQWPDHYTYFHHLQVGMTSMRGLWGDVIVPGEDPVPIVNTEWSRIEYRRVFGDLYRFKEAEFRITDAHGRSSEVHAESLIMNSLKGGGYSGYRGFHHGAYKGDYWEDGEVWDLTSSEDAHELDWPLIHEHWARFESEDVEGIGMMEISDATGVEWFRQHAPDRLVISD